MKLGRLGMVLLGVFALLGCKDDDAPYLDNVYYVPSTLHFEGYVNGVPHSFPTDEGNYSNISRYEYDFAGPEGKIHFNSSFEKAGAPCLSISFRNFYQGDSAVSTLEFQQIFGIGARGYLPSFDPTLPGIGIRWTLPNGQAYRTELGPQAGQLFNVDENSFSQNNLTETATLGLSFSCLLYDSLGNVLPLEQGKAIILFSKP